MVLIPEFAFGAAVRTAAMPAIAHAQDRNQAMGAPWRRLISGLGRAWTASGVMAATLILRAQFSTQRPALWDLPESALVGAAAYVIALLYLELVRPAYLASRPRIRAWPAPATF